MITVIKIPIYLSIETDNMDRSVVTKTAQQIVVPRLIKSWQSKGLTGLFTSADIQRVDAILGKLNEWKLLTDVQAMEGR